MELQEQLTSLMPLLTQYGVKVLGAIALIALSFWTAAKVSALTVRSLRRAQVDETLTKFASGFIKWVVLLVAGISILGMFGIQTTSFAALIAASGLAIGLAFQGTLSNFSAGVMLLIFRPFRVGQLIKVAGESGTVDSVDLFTTTLDTVDNRRIILPNSSVFGSTIENVSHHDLRRVDVTVGVDYSADLDETRSILTAVPGRVSGALSDPKPAIVLCELSASSVDWALRVWVKAADYWPVRERLLTESKIALDRAGIGIPFPQMDVHVHGAAVENNTTMARDSDSAPPAH